MTEYMSSIRSLCPGRETWKIRARVIRKWEMAPTSDLAKPYALQLVLIDSESSKIEATIKKYMISKFVRDIVEGNVYQITYFNVVDNNGSYRAAEHEYRIMFNSKTKVQIDQYFIGLVSTVSNEQQFSKSGNVNRKIELEIIDHKYLALFGNYVDVVKGFLAAAGVGLGIIVVQFAKIKTYKGEVGIQNVMQATKLLWNAEIPEVAAFRDGLALHGIDDDLPIGQIGGVFQHIPANEEFITMFPRKSIVELHDTAEEGLFVVLGHITKLVDGEKWWYTACRCRRSVTVEDGLYFCAACSTHVIDVTPRFRLKVDVYDGDEVATFVIFDGDCENIIKKSCRELFAKAKCVDDYPDEIKALIGREFLFKVEKSMDHGMKFDDSYKIKKICEDKAIIELFKDEGNIQTPTKLIADTFCAKSSSEDPNSVFTDGSIGCSSAISAVPDSTASLDDLSPFKSPSVCSVDASVDSNPESNGASVSKPAKKKKLIHVKIEE
ncbi:uncharacterized protein LOC130744238 [Lotus japonicus]|uniref:uncharacterized protein LOC130744238 n=1 Tax=Lotus japonicus TaxID=34305 RepID=UPI002590156B|nr:uncharacterized protein LOC130744238 [Lotus japonicus]